MSIPVQSGHTSFCCDCAERAFSVWRGWCSYGTEDWDEDRRSLLLPIPDLPIINGKLCPVCGSVRQLAADLIVYENIHEPGNTGLPDY